MAVIATLDSSSERLARDYLPLADSLAARYARFLPHDVDRDDIRQNARLGLVKATRSYDPERGAAFATHATRCIRSAILDAARRDDPLRRPDRAFSRTVTENYFSFAAREHRFPTVAEQADRLGVSPRELSRRFEQVGSVLNRASLDEQLTDEFDDSGSVVETVRDLHAELAFERICDRQDLAELLPRLRPREAMVIGLYYWQGLTLPEIAEILGVTASRVCQIHVGALRRLRDLMSEPVAA